MRAYLPSSHAPSASQAAALAREQPMPRASQPSVRHSSHSTIAAQPHTVIVAMSSIGLMPRSLAPWPI